MKRLLPCLLAALAGSWEVDDQGRLTASLQVATLDPATRRLDVPEGARIWLEVGTNSRNWLANCELLCEGYDDVYIVSFEPLLEHYGRVVAGAVAAPSGGAGGLRRLDGRRGVALPFALDAVDGEADFHVAAQDGCSALAKPIPGERACATVGGVRRVPTMTLKSVFDVLLPVGAHVDFLYVDAQGHGLKILEGAGDSLARVDAIVVDALLRDEALMYETQNGCAATVEFAAAAGFHVPFETRAFLCDHAADHAGRLESAPREINVFFARDATRARPICPHVLDYCIEREDVLTVGFHAQLPTCRGDERCETDVCREGEGHCLIYLDARNCWCTTWQS